MQLGTMVIAGKDTDMTDTQKAKALVLAQDVNIIGLSVELLSVVTLSVLLLEIM